MRRKDRLFEVERERGRLVRELLARPSIEHAAANQGTVASWEDDK